MNVQVRTSDGRIYDATVAPNATVADLQQILYSPYPVPKNSSIMGRTRLLDPSERMSNVAHLDLFLVGSKPEAVRQQFQNQQQQQQQAPQQRNSPQSSHTNNNNNNANRYSLGGDNRNSNNNNNNHSPGRNSGNNNNNNQNQQYNQSSNLNNAKQAVSHLEQFVASPQGNNNQSPQFGSFQQPPLPAHYQQQKQFYPQNNNNTAPPPVPPQQQYQQYNNNNNNNSNNYNQNQNRSNQQNNYDFFTATNGFPEQQHNNNNFSAQHQDQTPASNIVIVKQMPKDPRELLIYIRQTFTHFNQQVLDPNVSKKAKGLIGEESMKLLYKLDDLMDLDADLKAERKQLVKDIQQMQDTIDGKSH